MHLRLHLRQVLRRDALLPPGATVVVGVSGGADSLALLHLLVSLRADFGWSLHAATFDHGLRGAAGAADAAFVARTGAAWHVPVTRGAADPADIPAPGSSGIEAWARAARYDFLAGVARAVGAGYVAVGHHAGDQAETVLLHLLRGSGLRGLGGMPPSTTLPGHADLILARPLLTVSRADIDAYCREHDLQPRHDPTNTDPTFLRNRLRHDIIPRLSTINPRLEDRLGRLAQLARLDDDFIGMMLHNIIDQHVHQTGQPPQVSIPRVVFVDLHPALQRRLLLYAAAQVVPAAEISAVHLDGAVQVALSGAVGARALLPGGGQVRLEYEQVMIERADADEPALPTDQPLLEAGTVIPLPVPGATRLNADWRVIVSETPLPDAQVRLAVPPSSRLSIRTRRPGDRFAPLGMGGHSRKLSDWLIDQKIAQSQRDRIALLLVDDTIAAVLIGPGWPISQTCAVTPVSPANRYIQLTNQLDVD